MLYDVWWRIANSAGSSWILHEEVEADSTEGAHLKVLKELEEANGDMPILVRSYPLDEATQIPYKRVTRWEQA